MSSSLSEILGKLLYLKKMRPIDLARETNIPQPTMHRLVSGKSPSPHKATLEPIAKFFEISVEQLIGEEPFPANLFPPDTTKSFKVIEIPLLEWSELGKLDQNPQNSAERIAALNDLSENCFATKMTDSSMEPQFPKGCILIFDPKKKLTDRSFILVKLFDSQLVVFRQLLIDAEHQFLKPLNPDLHAFKMRVKRPEDVILGNLVESRHVYSER